MSKIGRGRRTAEQQREARKTRTAQGDKIREAWTGLAEIADERAKRVGVSLLNKQAGRQ